MEDGVGGRLTCDVHAVICRTREQKLSERTCHRLGRGPYGTMNVSDLESQKIVAHPTWRDGTKGRKRSCGHYALFGERVEWKAENRI